MLLRLIYRLFLLVTFASPLFSSYSQTFYTEIEADEIAYTVIDVPHHAVKVELGVWNTEPLFKPVVLLKYDGLPTTTDYDFQFEMPIAPYSLTLVDYAPTRALLYVGLWGGEQVHSYRFFAGNRVYSLFQLKATITTCYSEWQRGSKCSGIDMLPTNPSYPLDKALTLHSAVQVGITVPSGAERLQLNMSANDFLSDLSDVCISTSPTYDDYTNFTVRLSFDLYLDQPISSSASTGNGDAVQQLFSIDHKTICDVLVGDNITGIVSAPNVSFVLERPMPGTWTASATLETIDIQRSSHSSSSNSSNSRSDNRRTIVIEDNYLGCEGRNSEDDPIVQLREYVKSLLGSTARLQYTGTGTTSGSGSTTRDTAVLVTVNANKKRPTMIHSFDYHLATLERANAARNVSFFFGCNSTSPRSIENNNAIKLMRTPPPSTNNSDANVTIVTKVSFSAALQVCLSGYTGNYASSPTCPVPIIDLAGYTTGDYLYEVNMFWTSRSAYALFHGTDNSAGSILSINAQINDYVSPNNLLSIEPSDVSSYAIFLGSVSTGAVANIMGGTMEIQLVVYLAASVNATSDLNVAAATRATTTILDNSKPGEGHEKGAINNRFRGTASLQTDSNVDSYANSADLRFMSSSSSSSSSTSSSSSSNTNKIDFFDYLNNGVELLVSARVGAVPLDPKDLLMSTISSTSSSGGASIVGTNAFTLSTRDAKLYDESYTGYSFYDYANVTFGKAYDDDIKQTQSAPISIIKARFVWRINKPVFPGMNARGSAGGADQIYWRVDRIDDEGAQPPALLVGMQTFVGSCDESLCDHGTCIRNEGVVSWVGCDCKFPWAGERCDEMSMSYWFYVMQVTTLVVSNLAMAPSVWYCYMNRLPIFIVVLSCASVASSFYHLCDTDTFCLFDLSFSSLQTMDVLFSLVGMSSMGLFFAPVSDVTHSALVALVIGCLISPVAYDPTNSFNIVIAIALPLLFTLLMWVKVYRDRGGVCAADTSDMRETAFAACNCCWGARRVDNDQLFCYENVATSSSAVCDGNDDSVHCANSDGLARSAVAAQPEVDTLRISELRTIPIAPNDHEHVRFDSIKNTGTNVEVNQEKDDDDDDDGEEEDLRHSRGESAISRTEQQTAVKEENSLGEEEKEKEEEEEERGGQDNYYRSCNVMFIAASIQTLMYNLRYGLFGLTMSVIGLSCFAFQTRTNYWLVHSLWHCFVMLATLPLLIGRRDFMRYMALKTGILVETNFGGISSDGETTTK